MTGAGNGSSDSLVLFAIDQTTAATTRLCAFVKTTNGVALAFNPKDESLYFMSSSAELLKVTDISGALCAVTPIRLSPEPSVRYIGALTYLPAEGGFVLVQADDNYDAYKLTAAGETTGMGKLKPFLKGVAVSKAAAPSDPACPPTGAMYGTANGQLYRIDPMTGKAVLILNFADSDLPLTDIAFLPDGSLYGLTLDGLSGNGAVVKIDPCTGARTVIGPTGVGFGNEEELGVVRGLTFAPEVTPTELYAYNRATSKLESLDIATGAATDAITLSDPIGTPVGFDFDSDHTAVFVNVDHVFTANFTTGAVTTGPALVLPAPLAGNGYAPLALTTAPSLPASASTDTFFAAFMASSRSVSFLTTVNRSTGEVRKIGQSICRLETLAFFPDTDGDGVTDGRDACPYDAIKTAPGVCGCSTPDSDDDGDGLLLCQEQCPNDPNKTEPLLCGCGNPESDSNGDYVVDCGLQLKSVNPQTVLAFPPHLEEQQGKIIVTMQGFSGITPDTKTALIEMAKKKGKKLFKYVVMVTPQGASKPALQLASTKNSVVIPAKTARKLAAKATDRTLLVSYQVTFYNQSKKPSGAKVLKKYGVSAVSPTASITYSK